MPVFFDFNGPLLGITHAPGTPEIIVTNAGIYSILYSFSSTQINQFTVFVNGAPAASTRYGMGQLVSQNNGFAILELSAGDVLTLVNSTSTAGVATQVNAGGPGVIVNASFLIERIA